MAVLKPEEKEKDIQNNQTSVDGLSILNEAFKSRSTEVPPLFFP